MSHLVPVPPRPSKKWGLCPTNSGFVHATFDAAHWCTCLCDTIYNSWYRTFFVDWQVPVAMLYIYPMLNHFYHQLQLQIHKPSLIITNQSQFSSSFHPTCFKRFWAQQLPRRRHLLSWSQPYQHRSRWRHHDTLDKRSCCLVDKRMTSPLFWGSSKQESMPWDFLTALWTESIQHLKKMWRRMTNVSSERGKKQIELNYSTW